MSFKSSMSREPAIYDQILEDINPLAFKILKFIGDFEISSHRYSEEGGNGEENGLPGAPHNPEIYDELIIKLREVTPAGWKKYFSQKTYVLVVGVSTISEGVEPPVQDDDEINQIKYIVQELESAGLVEYRQTINNVLLQRAGLGEYLAALYLTKEGENLYNQSINARKGSNILTFE